MAEVVVGGQRIKWIIRLLIVGPIILILLVFLIVYFKKWKTPTIETPPLEVGRAAPDFTFPDLKGRKISLSALRGKVVFINIWATWCPTCIWEMPSMEKLYQRLKGRDFEILAVSIDALGAQVVAPFMEKYKLTFPALLDPKGKIKRLYKTTGVPESFFVDKDGVLVKKVIGPRDWYTAGTIHFFEELIRKGSSSSNGNSGIKESSYLSERRRPLSGAEMKTEEESRLRKRLNAL